MEQLLLFALVIGTGFLAGIINTMAAGGSLLTLPMLIFMGLPSAVANGTNRVAIALQSVVATRQFAKHGLIDRSLAIGLGIPAVLGSFVGANIAVTISDESFNRLLAVMMVITVLFIIWKPNVTTEPLAERTFSPAQKIAGVFIFFFIGLYGGFIQAGAGFFIIAALTALFGLSLVESNGLKVFIGGLYITLSLGVFIWNGHVDWVLGLSLAFGNMLGAWVGSFIALTKGDRWIKVFLLVTVAIMAMKLLEIGPFA